MVQGYYIEISNGLLQNGHRKKMGEAVWEFMWCLDHITMIDDDGTGWVLGGKPVNLKDLSVDMDVHFTTISRNINKLTEQGYLTLIHTPYGIKIGVKKAKKKFKKHSGNAVNKSVDNRWTAKERFSTNAKRFSTNANPNIRQYSVPKDSINTNTNFLKLKNTEKGEKFLMARTELIKKLSIKK
ncbi:MAG: hypothetical protein NTZ18_03840 [Candidatus Komeilibacteria bacterium]|nr:hypothetical protein [Candidatus Komeilibacteria bacterium]